MPLLLQPMPSEPPPSYVTFVERHLDPLRRDAAGVVGSERDADRLYPLVLADVAAWWRSLELLRRLGMTEVAERFLRLVFRRRAMQWRPEEEWAVDIEVLRPGERPEWSSAALRLARYAPPPTVIRFEPLLEATIAWLHAYEARCRLRFVARTTALLVAYLTLVRLQHNLADAQWAALVGPWLLRGRRVGQWGLCTVTGARWRAARTPAARPDRHPRRTGRPAAGTPPGRARQ